MKVLLKISSPAAKPLLKAGFICSLGGGLPRPLFQDADTKPGHSTCGDDAALLPPDSSCLKSAKRASSARARARTPAPPSPPHVLLRAPNQRQLPVPTARSRAGPVRARRIPPSQPTRPCPPRSPSDAHAALESRFPAGARAGNGPEALPHPGLGRARRTAHSPSTPRAPEGFPPHAFGAGAAGTVGGSTGPPAACRRAWPSGRWGEQRPLRSRSDKRGRRLGLFQGLAIFKSCFSCFPS